MTSATTPLQSSTIPEFVVDGRAQPDMARDIVLLQIDEDIDGMKRMQATLVGIGPRSGARDEQLNWVDGSVLDFGKEMSISMGPSEARERVFKGKVSALELSLEQGRAPEVLCFAEDRLMDLRMTRRFRSYENMSDADLVQQIASQHGLRASADLDGPTYAMIQQWNQSDLAFLRERARRMAAEVWVEDDTLHMAQRERRDGRRLTLVQGGNLMQVRLRADLAQQRTSLVVGGFDDAEQDALSEEADSATVSAEAQGNRHGLEVLERAMGQRISHRVREVPLKDAEARALARAALLTRARRFVCVAGVADGMPSLGVGSLLRLERVGALFEGDGFYVTRVRHQFDQTHGYRTHFEAERGWIGSAA